MFKSDVSSLNQSFQKAHEWLEELREEGRFDDEAQAYAALRSVLQTLRDRLTVPTCANLGAQLPLVLRGLYYEGWKPESAPIKYRSRSELFANVGDLLSGSLVKPEHACRAVFSMLDRRLSPGAITSVKNQLPRDLATLWPSRAGAETAVPASH